MPIPWPSEEWIVRWVGDLNASEPFRSAASRFQGSFGSVIRAHPPQVPSDIHLCFEVSSGTFIRYAYRCEQGQWNLQFVIEAGYTTWKKFIGQELDPVRAMLLGHVRIRGNAAKALRFSRAVYEMVRTAGEIPTSFP